MQEILQRNDLLNGSTHYALGVISPWFEDNKLVFFPEYTDHGIRHIQEVFDTTEALIPKGGWEILTPEDVATLILAIILHDCAMHISEDGFITLLSDDSKPRNELFSDKPWRQLWDEFMSEARRFDERKLKALFDEVEPIHLPNLDPLKMTKKDRLLIGEFLRRHHPRLAHEIALTGVPGPLDKGLSLGNVPDNIKDLAGTVARSHGMNLRVCVDYLNGRSRWGARRTTGVHVTYLMALVRIADYLQIHSRRAPQEVLQVRSLKSPVSRGEWKAHATIIDIHQETDDPEAFWVEAAPKDIKTYLKLRHLLNDIQREIDDSWAVLGEVYGPKEGLRTLGLTVRRIRSNLDDSVAFAKTVEYFPHKASIETQGADLLKLLIVPLYGNNPEIGVRELLQNAVDACRELQDYLDQHPQADTPDLQEQSADIVISLEEKSDGSFWAKISDKGIGMTIDTVLNYFLKAGASFRNSDTWRRFHEDSDGNIRVLRSGRFGIGVLAGFLLGEEIQVTTRHVTARKDDGVSFACSLTDEAIQINRASAPVGTTIRIKLPPRIYKHLSKSAKKHSNWDWYCLQEPSVHRVLSNGDIKLEQRFSLPAGKSQLPTTWRRIQHPKYQDIQWSYLAYSPYFVCNGIAIKEVGGNDDLNNKELSNYKAPRLNNWLDSPKISLFDVYGELPLNLQRTHLSGMIPFKSELIKDVCRDILAYMMVYTPKQTPTINELCKGDLLLKYPGIALQRTWYFYTAQGISTFSDWNYRELSLSNLFLVTTNEESRLKDLLGEEVSNPIISVPRRVSSEYTPNVLHLINNDFPQSYGRRILLSRGKYEKMQKEGTPDADTKLNGYTTEWKDERWLLLRKGGCPTFDFEFDKISRMAVRTQDDCLAIIYPHGSKHIFTAPVLNVEPQSMSQLEEAWRSIIKFPYIPYDRETRKTKLAHAYKELWPYILAWLKYRSARAARV
ncbi:MAG: molecular chaperone HtpG [Acidobacteriota bacterium]|nr:molecular chaperone HtpG [Acidobacteriota bacterium]